MKIFFAVPSYAGLMDAQGKPRCPQFMLSLVQTIELCEKRGYEVVPMEKSLLMGCAYLQVARNELVKAFMETDADIFFFVDDDVSWSPEDALRMIEMEDEFVAGIYPYKTEREDYPVVIFVEEDGRPRVREDGCIYGCQVPTGFMRLKRSVLESMCKGYKERSYFKNCDGSRLDGFIDLFPQGLEAGQWIGEDYAFCRLWLRAGLHRKEDKKNEIIVVPDVNLSHWSGEKEFKGNYHRFLMRQPGGKNAKPFKLDAAAKIKGWLSLQEAEQLAEWASTQNTIIELGSFFGKSTRAMADNTEGTVFAVDNWKGPRDSGLEPEILATAYSEFRKNLHDHIDTGKVITVTCNHEDFDWELFIDSGVDMVFIDGDHSKEAVQRDVQNALSVIRPGGLICGHDFDWRQVRDGLREILPEAQHVQGTSLWFYVKVLPTVLVVEGEKKEGRNGTTESNREDSKDSNVLA